MPIQLKNDTPTFLNGKNILASSHVQFKEVGGTMDATKFSVGKVEAGTVLARVTSTGKYVPFKVGEITTYDDYAILNVDFMNDGKTDTIVGELIVRGSVYKAKLVGVTAEFIAKTPMIRYV